MAGLSTRRFVGDAYRGHDPAWAHLPTSGDGAAIGGGRFNPKGVPALYLSLKYETVFKEITAGLLRRFDPITVCRYEIDCDLIVDLSTEIGWRAASISMDEMSCGWMSDMDAGREPASWNVYRRLRGAGAAGVLVPSFAVGAKEDDVNLVLWRWSEEPPQMVKVYDPKGRLPKDQSSWR